MEGKKKAGHTGTGNNNSNKINKLLIECILIGDLLPCFKITYQNRVIEGMFSKSIWNDEAAILKMATGIIEQRHIVEPFNTLSHE